MKLAVVVSKVQIMVIPTYSFLRCWTQTHRLEGPRFPYRGYSLPARIQASLSWPTTAGSGSST